MRHRGKTNDRPVQVQEVFASIYNNLGISPKTTIITDLKGRPHYLVDKAYKSLPEVA